jgi:prepilin signal peptidase PulO-like enzyme (type II secretory pathway)
MLVYSTLVMVGACLGSFASAIAHRVRNGKSWIKDRDSITGKAVAARSACPMCGHQLSFFDLVPILSWVCSLGRCRYCSGKISPRYPIVEVSGGIILAVFYAAGVGVGILLLFSLVLPFALAGALMVWGGGKLPVPFYGAMVSTAVLFCYVFIRGA